MVTKRLTKETATGGEIRMTTEEIVKQICKEQGMSVAKLAAALGQSRQNFYKKLQRDTLTAQEWQEAAKVLGVEFDQGFVLPDGFFSGYIAGSGEPKVSLYETSASTLSSAICETFFHYIFKVASPQILVDTIDDAALSEELKSRMQAYMNSDTIFRMSSVTDGAYDYKENTYRIQLPIYECTCLLVLFASLFSLMLFLQDQERGIYIALSGKRRYGILCTGLLAGILPIYGIGMLCNGITYGTATLLQVTLVSLLACLLSLVLSVFIKKSRTLAKWIPVLLLITIVYFFVNYE